MATSGNTSWQLQRDDIIAAALRKLGVLAKGQLPDTEDLTYGAQALNSVVALFATDGMPLWKREIKVLALVGGQKDYTINDALKVYSTILVDKTSTSQYQITGRALTDFLATSDSQGGAPVYYTFTPEIQNGTYSVWPTPDAAVATQYELWVLYQKEFDGFFASTETPDFPAYWTDALIYGLAVRLAPEYGLPLQDRNLLIKEAELYKKLASDFGDDGVSIFFQPHDRC